MMKKHYLFSFLFLVGCFFQPLFAQPIAPINMTLRSEIQFPDQTLANICGYAANGKEYALLGGSKQFIIVDVTNPSNPTIIARFASPNSVWKEIKVYKNCAYAVSEGGQGLHVVDLTNLPDSSQLRQYFYQGDASISLDDTMIVGRFNRFHSLHIDTTKGFLYVFGGTNTVSNGAVILDVKTDPYHPRYAGKYQIDAANSASGANYVHDGYVDNDTLYAGHIYTGNFTVVDMSNKTNGGTVLGSQTTPNTFTHNIWPTGNKKVVLTTDERANSYVAAYDISNPANIKALDKIRTPQGQAIPHNTHIQGNYAYTSWYTEGMTIIDVTRPDNLVMTNYYDTWAPDNSGNFNGAWGVYPFLPSGTQLISNFNLNASTGYLTLLTPTVKRASYLEGVVVDSLTNQPLVGVTVKINSTDLDKRASSNNLGVFKTGQVTEGTFTATFAKQDYVTKTVPITMTAGGVFTTNIQLAPVVLSLGTVKIDDNLKLTASPNPFQTTLRVAYEMPNSVKSVRLMVLNTLGQVVERKQLDNSTTKGEISIGSQLPNGFYFIRLESNEGVGRGLKVLKEN